MTTKNQNLGLRHTFYPKCPYNDSIVLLVLRISTIVLGTIGLMVFNELIATVYLAYSLIYNVVIWPVIHCKHCYYKVKEFKKDEETGEVSVTLLPIEKWKESSLDNHVACGKKWGAPNLMILWLTPIILIIISFLIDFSIYALFILISFIATLALIGIYTRKRICTTCAFMEECHASF